MISRIFVGSKISLSLHTQGAGKSDNDAEITTRLHLKYRVQSEKSLLTTV